MTFVHSLRWQNLLDFLVLAVALYVLIRWAKAARALRIALGIAGLHAAAGLAEHFGLFLTSWVLDAAAVLAIIVLVVVFQRELRSAFMTLDARILEGVWRRQPKHSAFREIATAAFRLARNRVGALLVLVGDQPVHDLTDGGIVLDAEVSADLLESIFQKDTPLHDGAVVIENGRIRRAKVILPLTHRRDMPHGYGTRHRAAMGLAERSDAMVVAVSEQRGDIHVVRGREIMPAKTPKELVARLQSFSEPPVISTASRIRELFTSNLDVKIATVVLAGLISFLSFSTQGTTVRTITVPVEFGNVPAGMEIASQSSDDITVQLRGNRWLMDETNFDDLVAHFALRGRRPGWRKVTVSTNAVSLPAGIMVERVTPRMLEIMLRRRKKASPQTADTSHG